MASSLWSGSVKLTPATAVGGYGTPSRPQPLHGGNFCSFTSKRPVVFSPLRASSPTQCSAPSSTVATTSRTPPATSPPSDLKPSPVPLLLVPQILLNQDEYEIKDASEPYIFYSVSEKKTVTVPKNQKSWRRDQIVDAHWIGSSKGWIMYMNRQNCNLYLCNPNSPTTSPIIPLPPIETLPRVAARNFRRRRSETDENDISSTELDFEFVLEEKWYDDRYGDFEEYAHEFDNKTAKWFENSRETVPPKDLINKCFVRKFALSSAPPSPANNYRNFRSCIVAIICGFSEVAVCRLGDKRWTYLDCAYSDAIFSKHDDSKLFLYKDGYDITLCQLNNSDLSSSKLNVIHNFEEEHDGLCGTHYLAESATEPGHLFDVCVSHYCDEIDVHRLSLLDGEEKWVRVDSLEDQALFVGDYSEGISVPAAQLPANVKPNCAYFTHFYSCKMGVYSLEDRVLNFHAFDDGIRLDLSSFGMKPYDHSTREDDGEEHSKEEAELFWLKQFGMNAEGWAVWVAPNPW